MVFYSINSTFIKKLLFSQRKYISNSVVGFYSYSQHPAYLGLLSTKNCAVTLSNCGCFARSYGLPARHTLHTPSIIVRTYGTLPDNEKSNPKPSLYQRFKAMYRDYWYVLLPVHIITSVAWFGSFFYLSSSGVDIVSLLESLNVSDKIINPLRNGHSTTGHLAIAFALYKVASPLRYTVTLGGTTVTINYLKKWGYIKPVPSKEKLKEMYEGKKEIFKEKGQSMIKSLKQTASKKPPTQ